MMRDKNSTNATDRHAKIFEFYFTKCDLFLKAGHFPTQVLDRGFSFMVDNGLEKIETEMV